MDWEDFCSEGDMAGCEDAELRLTWDWINLAKAGHANSDASNSSYGIHFAIGASLGAAVALGAVMALRKWNKGNVNHDSFQRA